MRLVFVAPRYWPAIGGVESFIRHLALELGSRHQVTVLARRIDEGPTTRLTDSLRPPPTFEPFEDGPVQVMPLRISVARQMMLTPLSSQVVPGLRRYAYGRLRILAAALHARAVAPIIARHLQGADATHVWGGDLLASASVRAARLATVPLVITPLAHRGQFGDDPASVVAYRRANRVISVLEADAKLYRELGVREDRLLRCGVCSPAIPPGGGPAIRQRYSITGPLVIYLGVRRPYKGFDLLLEAARRLAAEAPQITFAFIGPGARLSASNGGGRILDVGLVDDTNRAAWLDAADLLCLPSAGETFGVSILEAWSLQKPVLTSDVPSLREVVEAANGGVAIPRNSRALARAIVDLLADPSKLRAMGKAGHAYWARHYTVSAVGNWHEQLYKSLVEPVEEAATCSTDGTLGPRRKVDVSDSARVQLA